MAMGIREVQLPSSKFSAPLSGTRGQKVFLWEHVVTGAVNYETVVGVCLADP